MIPTVQLTGAEFAATLRRRIRDCKDKIASLEADVALAYNTAPPKSWFARLFWERKDTTVLSLRIVILEKRLDQLEDWWIVVNKYPDKLMNVNVEDL